MYTDEDEETEPSPSGQQIIENSITMNKMKLLKAKMENMNLSKKVKHTAPGGLGAALSAGVMGLDEVLVSVTY